jgi:hypothetical protein
MLGLTLNRTRHVRALASVAPRVVRKSAPLRGFSGIVKKRTYSRLIRRA